MCTGLLQQLILTETTDYFCPNNRDITWDTPFLDFHEDCFENRPIFSVLRIRVSVARTPLFRGFLDEHAYPKVGRVPGQSNEGHWWVHNLWSVIKYMITQRKHAPLYSHSWKQLPLANWVEFWIPYNYISYHKIMSRISWGTESIWVFNILCVSGYYKDQQHPPPPKRAGGHIKLDWKRSSIKRHNASCIYYGSAPAPPPLPPTTTCMESGIIV